MSTDDDLEIALLNMTFHAADSDQLLAVLSKYVVMARHEPACRNADLWVSSTDPAKFVITQNWDSEGDARGHFDSPVMIEMAEGCAGILTGPPDIDLLEGISAHDLA